MSVLELTGAYTTFANNGVFNKPYYIQRIENKNGQVLYENFAAEQQALPPNPNYVMVEMLRYAGGLRDLKSDAGGKTGTTNDYADGWFVGITPNLVVGTWTGGEDRWISFRSIQMGQGAFMSKPLVKNFFKRLEEDPNSGYDHKERFYRPPGDLGIELDCNQYRSDLPSLEGSDEFEDEFSEDQFGDQFAPRDTTFQQR
jgi:penicillin-binding protein 1A